MRPGAFMQISVQRLVCTSCGVEANASCDCGKPYVPAKQRAAEAIAAAPHKSDRAIAKELGVNHSTVSRARAGAGVAEATPEREGLDGKVYKLPTRTAEREASIQEKNAFLVFANEALKLARYSGKVDGETIQAARDTAAAWNELVSNMERQK